MFKKAQILNLWFLFFLLADISLAGSVVVVVVGGGCWSLSQLQTGEGRDECQLIAGPCLSVWGLCYFAQGYLGSAPEVSWQLYCCKHKIANIYYSHLFFFRIRITPRISEGRKVCLSVCRQREKRKDQSLGLRLGTV